MKRIGLEGQSWAWAIVPESASTTAAAQRKPRSSDIGFVFVEMADRVLQRISAERVTEFPRHHQFNDRRLAVFLRLAGCSQRGTDIRQGIDRYAFSAHRLCNRRPARVLEVDALEAVLVEVD